jgi:hypothetical protein
MKQLAQLAERRAPVDRRVTTREEPKGFAHILGWQR